MFLITEYTVKFGNQHFKKLYLCFQTIELEMCELDFLMIDIRFLIFLIFDSLDFWPESLAQD